MHRSLLIGALLVSVPLAAVLFAPASAQSVDAGVKAWQRGEHAEAVSIWRPLAEAGDPDAEFNMGQAYRLGRGVPVNLGEAQNWLDRAARQGHLDAQVMLGLLLFENGDHEAGLRLLAPAAEKGEPRALLIVGTALFNGDGVIQDPVLAYAYISRAVELGLEPAKETLAELDRILPQLQRREGLLLAQERFGQQAAAAPPVQVPEERTQAEAAAAQPDTGRALAVQARSKAPARPGAKVGWRVQLGAFSRKSAAQALYRRLSAYPPIEGREPLLEAAGKVTRLQVGPFDSKASAEAACKTLARSGHACFVVAPE